MLNWACQTPGCGGVIWKDGAVSQEAVPHREVCPDQLGEVAERPEPRMDSVVITHVVAVIAPRARMDGTQPQAGHAEPGQVVQSADQASKVADPVSVGVLE